MDLLAVVPVAGAEERLEAALARVLGRSAYEVRSRTRHAAGPVVVASFADRGQAADIAESLAAYGFETHLVGAPEAESDARRFLVRRFELQEAALVAEAASGEGRTVPYAEVDLLLRGTYATTRTEMKNVERRRFSAARTLLTGGLVTSRTTITRREVQHEAREGFLHLYAAGREPLAFREGKLQYQGLGAELKPTRLLNFLHTIAQLQQRCPGALYDERLLTRGVQAQILGPALSPTRHLDLAISVLVRYLRARKGQGT